MFQFAFFHNWRLQIVHATVNPLRTGTWVCYSMPKNLCRSQNCSGKILLKIRSSVVREFLLDETCKKMKKTLVHAMASGGNFASSYCQWSCRITGMQLCQSQKVIFERLIVKLLANIAKRCEIKLVFVGHHVMIMLVIPHQKLN